jgi:hypothetical protein
MAKDTVTVNRAPVLTLWAAVVAERMGYAPDEALTLGKAVAGLNAQAKGRALGIYSAPKRGEGRPPKKRGLAEEFWVPLCGRGVPAKRTEHGVRAVVGEDPIDPLAVAKYLDGKFGGSLGSVREAMEQLAGAYKPQELAEAAYGLYEKFRPKIASGTRGWGQKGELDLGLIRSLGTKR